jgi:hypothetical protein
MFARKLEFGEGLQRGRLLLLFFDSPRIDTARRSIEVRDTVFSPPISVAAARDGNGTILLTK